MNDELNDLWSSGYKPVLVGPQRFSFDEVFAQRRPPYRIDAADLERMHGNDEPVTIASLESGLKMITGTFLEVAAK